MPFEWLHRHGCFSWTLSINGYYHGRTRRLGGVTFASIRLRTRLRISVSASTVTADEKGLAISPAPCYLVFRSGSLQRDPAAAAKAGFPTFTLICFGFASSRFGMFRVSTPF